jgi:hypothetical protein
MMIRHKSKVLYLAGLLCLFQGVFVGCGSTDLFNDTFLNTFFSWAGGSLNTVQAKGPLTIVLENLTYEYRHGEYAAMGISYIDADGNTMTVSNRILDAVALDNRDPSSDTYDSDYREVIILDCGLQEIWFTATVYRTTITSDTETITLSSSSTLDITYATIKSSAYTSFTAAQTPSAHLVQDEHFECGDVIVVGLLDARYSNGAIIPQTYDDEITYTDLSILSGTWDSTAKTYTYEDVYGDEHVASSVTVYSSNFILDASKTLLRGEYYYPAAYVLVPLALPNIDDVSGDVYSATSALENQAAEYGIGD